MESDYFEKGRLKKQSHDYYRNLWEDRKEKKKDNIQGIDAKIYLMRKSRKESNHYKASKNCLLMDYCIWNSKKYYHI